MPRKGTNEGVSLAFKTSIIRDHHVAPIVTKDRFMTVRLPIPKEYYITLISAYAPTLDADQKAKNQFYQ